MNKCMICRENIDNFEIFNYDGYDDWGSDVKM